jgi:hypothetical protein
MVCQGTRYTGVYIPLTDQELLYLSLKKWFYGERLSERSGINQISLSRNIRAFWLYNY